MVATQPRKEADWVWAAGSAKRDLYHETHCKLRSSAAVGTIWYPTPIVPRRGTDASTMMLRMIVGPALRNQERVRWCLSHSCAPSELAVGFWKIRVPSGHGADRLSKIRQIRNQKKKSVINLASVGEHRSICTRDNPCSLYHRVRGSLPQITDVHGCGCEASLFKYKVNCFCQLFPI